MKLAIDVADEAIYDNGEMVVIRAEQNNKLVDSFLLSLTDLATLDFLNENIPEDEMYQRIKKFCDNRPIHWNWQ